MRALELHQMEQIEGGIDCETSVGLGLGFIFGAVVITLATGGAGGAVLIPALLAADSLADNCPDA